MKKLILVTLLFVSQQVSAGCYVSYQTNASISIPHATWVTVPAYQTQNSNNCTDVYNLTTKGKTYDFTNRQGVWILATSLRWGSRSDTKHRIVRFARNPDTSQEDPFASQDRTSTSGKDYVVLTYPVKLGTTTTNTKVGVQVYQSSGSSLNLELAQFKATYIGP